MGRKALISLALLISGTAVAAQQASSERPSNHQPTAESFEGRLLKAHNEERAVMRVEALVWSDSLAVGAQDWADHLAKLGLMQHAPTPNLDDPGENLWTGSKGRYTPEQMIDLFVAEKQYFKAGNFPDVSTTGRWQDVGHYTQVIWPTTRQVGCASAEGKHFEFLVCRYYPAGNWRKKPVGYPMIPTIPAAVPSPMTETDPPPASQTRQPGG